MAVETASVLEDKKELTGDVHAVICTGKLARRKPRAASAGLMKLLPMPPNGTFTRAIANTLPSTHIHQGAETGRFIPSNMPVTAAERSPIVAARPIRR